MAVIAVLALAGCTSEVGTLPGGGKGDGMMPVNLTIVAADYSQNTRASVKGMEGIEEGSVQILCFDKGGYFLGMGQDVTIAPCTDGDGHNHSLKATVYNSTARIHLLANAHITMDSQWVGMGENTLMARLESKYDTHEHMVYWGYRKMDSPEKMKAFLSNSSSVIYMLRDRARVTLSYDSNESEIARMQVALAGGTDRGSMAPLDRSTLAYPEIKSDKDWQTSLDFISVPSDAEYLGLTDADFADKAFAYETENTDSKPLTVILRAEYTSGEVRYHKLYLQDSEYNNYTVKRNHTYCINVQRLNAQYGYATAQEALSGQVSNDIWVTVADIVAEINAGDYMLRIGDGKSGATSVVYNYGAVKEQEISFDYSGDNSMSVNDFKCEWMRGGVGELADAASLALSYTPGDKIGTGKVSFSLGTIGENLNTATIKLQDKKHGLSRKIKLYSISHFSFAPYDEGITMENGTAGTEKTFKFTIPADYPKDLFPVKVMFASNDLNPRGMDVEVGSTNEKPINKEWNCWFTKKYYAPGTYEVNMRNVRTVTAGKTGKIYMKAAYFGKEDSTVNRAIEIPVTFN